ncbi:pleiotropic regulatory protein RsmS [Enterobacteriaceae bacterium 4M9]|nr:pleiotropic regulatory protein RsmS [Enterobacteriaceae bacterium 4M9]
MSLDTAPDEVKLAVDLIMLLEENAVPTQTALAALDIVRQDFLRKQAQETSASD